MEGYSKLLLPEVYDDIKIPNLRGSYSFQVKRTYNFTVQNNTFLIKHNMACLEDVQNDNVKIYIGDSIQNQSFIIPSEVVKEYFIVNGSITLVCTDEEPK